MIDTNVLLCDFGNFPTYLCMALRCVSGGGGGPEEPTGFISMCYMTCGFRVIV